SRHRVPFRRNRRTSCRCATGRPCVQPRGGSRCASPLIVPWPAYFGIDGSGPSGLLTGCSGLFLPGLTMGIFGLVDRNTEKFRLWNAWPMLKTLEDCACGIVAWVRLVGIDALPTLTGLNWRFWGDMPP